MKVALIDPIGHHGGHHYYTDQLALGLHQTGVEIVVYGLAGDSFCTRQQVYTYVQVFKGIYGNAAAPIRGLRFALGLFHIFADILRRGVEIVHINVWQWSVREWLQILLAKLAGKRIVLTIHDVETFGAATSELRRKFILDSATGLVIHNSFSLSCIPKQYLEGKHISIIPHVCHVDYIHESASRQAARERLRLPQDRTILLYFGNPRHEKGLDVAMKAMIFLKDMPELLMVTGGRMREQQDKEFREFIRSNGLQDSVRMDIGVVPDDVAFDYYTASNLVLTPYRRVYESGVAIMAASCARPIVASDLPVLVDFADEGRSGIIFRNEDSKHMAEVIRDIVGHPEVLGNMGEHARRNIYEQRNATLTGVKTAELYRRVLQ